MRRPPDQHLRPPIGELEKDRVWDVGKASLSLYRRIPTGTWIGALRKGATVHQFTGENRQALIEEMEAETSAPPPPIRGYSGAAERFLQIYPGGFSNPAFQEGERGGKLAAGNILRPLLNPETAVEDAVMLLKAARAALNKAGQSPLHMTESSDLDTVWHSRASERFIHGLRCFAAGERREGFELLEGAMVEGRFTWPMVTLFPALLTPRSDAVLRPEAVKTFARAVGSTFAGIYEPKPDLKIYEAYLDMLNETRERVKALLPSDFIDLASFVWVSTSYSASTAPR